MLCYRDVTGKERREIFVKQPRRKQNFTLAVDTYILSIPVGQARPIGINTGRTGVAVWYECSCGENLKLFSGLFTFLLR